MLKIVRLFGSTTYHLFNLKSLFVNHSFKVNY